MKSFKVLAIAAALLACGAVLVQARASAQGAAPTAGLAPLAVVAPTTPCADLVKADATAIGGPGSRIVSATVTMNRGIEVCQVDGVLAPTIGFKVLLPTKTWAQRYVQTGCGGLCGSMNINPAAAEGCEPVNTGGVVLATTDMGHTGPSGEFGKDPQKRADFAYRGVHLTALQAKALIKAYYGRAPAFSYFTGCSDGGREALMEAQRYPEDFNGIVAGAPAMNFQVQNSLLHGWEARSNTGPDGKAILVAARLPILHKAVLDACDKLDGLADGLLADPRLCRFDPATILCKTADQSACFTAAEVEAARKIYDGPRDPKTGERLTIGGPQPGSELAWPGVFVPSPGGGDIFSEKIALDSIRNLTYPVNPPADFALKDLAFTRASFDQLKALHPLYDATNPDLTAFAKRGGKLVMWHGWSDQHISPINTIAYHEAVETLMGKAQTAAFERLYLLPGVYHCGQGEGMSQIDLLTATMAWVETGAAPAGIVARQAPPRGPGGRPDAAPPPGAVIANAAATPPARTRTIFPFPALPLYDGKGDPALASSFTAGPRKVAAGTPAWAGSDFYRPYTPLAR